VDDDRDAANDIMVIAVISDVTALAVDITSMSASIAIDGSVDVADCLGLANTALKTGEDIYSLANSGYWTPYLQVPGVGQVYSKRLSIQQVDNRYFCFYQGENTFDSSDTDLGGYPYYYGRAFGYAPLDQACSFAAPSVGLPMTVLLPRPVMFNGQLYVFYGALTNVVAGSPVQLWYTSCKGSTWSPPALVPGVSILDTDGYEAVAATVFTPPGSDTAQLYLLYPTNDPSNSQLCNLGCVSTSDGQTWQTVNDAAVTGIGTDMMFPSAVTYTAPGSDSAQIYVFYVAAPTAGYEVYYSVYPDAAGGFSEPAAIPGPANICGHPAATVYTPAGSSNPLIYVYCTNGYGIYCSTFDGASWSDSAQVPNATVCTNALLAPSAAVFPPAAFNNTMSSATDIYLGTAQAATSGTGTSATTIGYDVVGSLSGYAAGTAPAPVTPVPSDASPAYEPIQQGPLSNTLLPVTFTGQATQPWAFYLSTVRDSPAYVYNYSTFLNGAWIQSALPAPTAPAALSITPVGSPSVAELPSAQGFSGNTYMLMNTSSGQLYWSSAGSMPLSTPVPIDGTDATGSPYAVYFNDTIYAFYQGAGSQAGQLMYTSQGSAGWTTPSKVTGATCSESPSATVYNGSLYVFYQAAGTNGQLWYVSLSASGAWSSPVQVVPTGAAASDVLLSGSPAAGVYTDADGNASLMVFYEGAACPGGWQLTYSTLGSDGSWTQAEVPGVVMGDSPWVYALPGSTKLNVFYELGSTQTPGQLAYSVYYGASWSPQGFLPVTTMTGRPTGLLYTTSTGAWLYLYHANIDATPAPFGFCPAGVPNVDVGIMYDTEMTVGNTEGTTTYYTSLMDGAPSGVITSSGVVWVFYRGCSDAWQSWTNGVSTSISPPSSVSSNFNNVLCYQAATLPTSPQQTALSFGEPTVTTFSMENSPSAVAFQSDIYVFYNQSGKLMVATTSQSVSASTAQVGGATFTQQDLGVSLTSECSPCAIVVPGSSGDTLYVFYATASSGPNNVSYITTQDGSTWTSSAYTSLATTGAGVMAYIYQNQLYLMYEAPDAENSSAMDTFYVPWTLPSGPEGRPPVTYPTQVGLLMCSYAPGVAVFNGTLWCITQGRVPDTSGSLAGLFEPAPTGYLWYTDTFDGTCWKWNTKITSTITQVVDAPSPVVFPPPSSMPGSSSTSSSLYAFYSNANGHVCYVSNNGATWQDEQMLLVSSDSDPAYAQDTPCAIAMPPLGSPSDPAQLFVFWQGSGNSGKLFYSTQTASGWSGAAQVLPTGMSTSEAIMSLSPSVVTYQAPGATAPQVYVFYEDEGSTGSDTAYIPLMYSTYANGVWTESQVPNITWTTPSVVNGLKVQSETWTGIFQSTAPRAIVFDGLLYVFYIAPTSIDETISWTQLAPIAYSTFDGTSWTGPKYLNDTQTSTCEPEFVSPVIFNGTLYVYFWNSNTAGALYYISTSNGTNWSAVTPATNVTYVPSGGAPFGSALLADETTAWNPKDLWSEGNDFLQFCGLNTLGEIINGKGDLGG
jgi:hypothetical protein